MFIRLLLASLILIILGQTPLITPLRGVMARVANPLQYSVYHFSQNLKQEVEFVLNLRRLRTENLKLSQQVLDLESQVVELTELKQENKLLKEQLEVTADQPSRGLVLSQVISWASGGGKATLTLNRGTKAGVREGAAVVLKNFLLGEVFAVEPEKAKVRLLTDAQFSAAALDQDSPNRTRGLVSGQYGTTVVLQKVLPTESLVVGDTIITSGEDGKFAKGLILGTVKRILGQEAEVFKEAELDLVVNFDLLEEVFVLR